MFSFPLSSHRYFVLIHNRSYRGTLFSLPLSSHRYFVLIYIIDHKEVLLQTYDLDLDLINIYISVT